MDDKKTHEWRLGEILIQKGWITWDQLDEALAIQRQRIEESNKFAATGIFSPRKGPALNLGEVLVRNGYVTWEDLAECLKSQKMNGKLLGDVLLDRKLVTRKDLTRALAQQMNLTFVDFDKIKIQPEAVQSVPRYLVCELKAMPLVRKNDQLLIAISNPQDLKAESVLTDKLQLEVHIALALESEILEAIKTYYP